MELQRRTAVLPGSAIHTVVRVLNVGACGSRIAGVGPVSLIELVIVHQRIILQVEGAGLSEEVYVAESRATDCLRILIAAKGLIELAQIYDHIPGSRGGRILIVAESGPGQLDAIIGLVHPDHDSALLKLRALAG